MIRWKLLIINAILLILSGYLCTYLIKLIRTPYDYDKLSVGINIPAKEKIIGVPKISKKYKPNLIYFKEIVQKDLFRPDRKEYIEEKKEEGNPEDSEFEQPNFIVRGITIFKDSYKAAIVEKLPPRERRTKAIRGKHSSSNTTRIPPKIYKEGDEIDDSGWIVKSIYRRRVEFCRGGHCFFVTLYKTYEDENYIPPKVPFARGKTSGKSTSSPQKKSTNFTAEEFKRLIQQGGRKKP